MNIRSLLLGLVIGVLLGGLGSVEHLAIERSASADLPQWPIVFPRIDGSRVATIEFPEEAARQGWAGEVATSLLIKGSGEVGRVELIAGSGRDTLDRAAMNGLRRYHFLPGTIAGDRVAMWIDATVIFRSPPEVAVDIGVVPEPLELRARTIIPPAFDYETSRMEVLLASPMSGLAPTARKIAVSALVGSDGKVLFFEFGDLSGVDQLDNAAHALFLFGPRFTPGQVDGKPARMWTTVTLGSERGGVLTVESGERAEPVVPTEPDPSRLRLSRLRGAAPYSIRLLGPDSLLSLVQGNLSSEICLVTIDWGDGKSATNSEPTRCTPEISHRYHGPGEYLIRVVTWELSPFDGVDPDGEYLLYVVVN